MLQAREAAVETVQKMQERTFPAVAERLLQVQLQRLLQERQLVGDLAGGLGRELRQQAVQSVADGGHMAVQQRVGALGPFGGVALQQHLQGVDEASVRVGHLRGELGVGLGQAVFDVLHLRLQARRRAGAVAERLQQVHQHQVHPLEVDVRVRFVKVQDFGVRDGEALHIPFFFLKVNRIRFMQKIGYSSSLSKISTTWLLFLKGKSVKGIPRTQPGHLWLALSMNDGLPFFPSCQHS